MALLEIRDLKTHYRTQEGNVHAVDGINLDLHEGETVGLVGESGSGKSTLARSINQILSDNAEIVQGKVMYDGVDLVSLSKKERRKYLWSDIAMIPQSAMNAMDPVYTIKEQIMQVIRAHTDATNTEAEMRCEELFEIVDLDKNRLDDYPHQFSGGMKQRAIIALALALEADILIADEPTTALDVIIQRQILQRLMNLQEDVGFAMVFVTHDIAVAANVCDRIAVLYGGRIVERGSVRTIINSPKHPYTIGLKNAFPSIEGEQDLISIPGNPPDLVDPDEKCRFVDRCPFAIDECQTNTPQTEYLAEGRSVECFRSEEAKDLQERGKSAETWSQMK